MTSERAALCGDDSWDSRYWCVKASGHSVLGPGLTDHDYRSKSMPLPLAATPAPRWPSRAEFRRMSPIQVNRFFESVGVSWRVATPAPREDGWDELRREIEALPDVNPMPTVDTGAATDWPMVKRAAVLAIVDRLAAATPLPGQERHEPERPRGLGGDDSRLGSGPPPRRGE